MCIMETLVGRAILPGDPPERRLRPGWLWGGGLFQSELRARLEPEPEEHKTAGQARGAPLTTVTVRGVSCGESAVRKFFFKTFATPFGPPAQLDRFTDIHRTSR